MRSRDGINCIIRAKGIPCEEYNTTENGSVNQCFIRSEHGATFAVAVTRDGNRNDMHFRIKLDGVEINKSSLKARTQAKSVEGQISGNTIRNFQWAPIKLTDEPSQITANAKVIRSLGVIEVLFFRVRLVKKTGPELLASLQRSIRHDRNAPNTRQTATASTMVFDETTKKASLSLVADLAEAKPYATDHHTPSAYRSITLDETPYLTFRFNYRTRAMLEAQGIVEMADGVDNEEDIEIINSPDASVSPAPEPKGMTQAEIARIKKENEELRQQIQAKRKRDSSTAGPSTSSKKFKSGEIISIDLTSD